MSRTVLTLSSLLFALPALGAERWDVGLAPKGSRIEAVAVAAASPTLPTVLLVGGLDGNYDTARRIQEEVLAFQALGLTERPFRLLAIPFANPERSGLEFPPTGAAFRENAESHFLWRWIGVQAPDLVLIAGPDEYGLAEALSNNVVASVGRIPAERVPDGSGMLQAAMNRPQIPPSEARREIERRRGRSPLELAEELSRYYGHQFEQLTYIPAMSLIGRLRLGHRESVQALVDPWVDGPRAGRPEDRPVSRNLAGYLVYGELAEMTGDPRYVEMVRSAANVGFTETGEMRESMGTSNGMSDGVFMSIPILGKAAKLTGEAKYCDMAARHLRVMQELDLRPDGLYQHSPVSSEVAWGRGNAFPALGIALTLSDCPSNHSEFNRMLASFQEHIAALAPFQDQDGMWRQVIDVPGAYPEFTATAMIGIAMLRGVRHGWLDAAVYQPRIDRAWEAILTRVGAEGVLMNLCESTNRQSTLEDYLHREAILGYDPDDLSSIRGGGMALIFATEMAGLQ